MSNISSQIRLDHVTYICDGNHFYFNGIIESESISALVGPSGSGKSTLILLIGGYIFPNSGNIYIGDTNVTHLPPNKRPLTILFQENNLFSHLNVFNNVALGRSPSLKLSTKDKEDVNDILSKLDIADKAKNMPNQLSGGEKQRVAIARTLLRNKPILILDEPFSALGPGMRKELLELLLDFKKNSPFTLLLVTHEPNDILFLDGKVFFINNHQIVEQGLAKDILSSSCSTEVKKYLGL
ncbi:ATP-binding cassette domain-containing protein [Bartonella sp. DGB1]|uniref:thiamine ABC transporter ATP-binding protein n=1 Tax=Bartonella sp. DGB1 TaxID=3239807 RepID=UPI0035231F90